MMLPTTTLTTTAMNRKSLLHQKGGAKDGGTMLQTAGRIGTLTNPGGPSRRQRYASKWQAGWDSSRAIEELIFILLATSFEHRIFSREVTAQFAEENLIIIL
jgi:hypothetical protein